MNLDQAKALDRKGWHKIADKLKPETRNFIDGKFVEARKGRTFESINPTDNSIICEMARSDASGFIFLVTLMHPASLVSGLQCFRSFDNGATWPSVSNCGRPSAVATTPATWSRC